MQGYHDIKELAKYCENKYDECGALVSVNIFSIGLEITIKINRPKIQLLQLRNIFSWEQVESLPIDIFKERVDQMVREIYLKYVEVRNLETLKM